MLNFQLGKSLRSTRLSIARPEEIAEEDTYHKTLRPTWGTRGEVVHIGSIEGGRPRGFGDVRSSGVLIEKLKYAGPSVRYY